MSCSRLVVSSVIMPLIFLAGIVNNSIAQSVNFGITGGVNISSHMNNFHYVAEDIDLEFNPRFTFGYQAGLVARTKLNNSLRFQTEPSLILLGARYEEPFTLRGFDFETESKTELLYIQLPLLLQLSTVPEDIPVYGRERPKTTFHITGGVFGGYLLDARFSGTNTGEPIGISFEGDFSNDVSSQYSSYDGGATLGAGFEHGNTKKIGFEARAQFSVIDSGDAPEVSFKPHNMAATFSVYFLL